MKRMPYSFALMSLLAMLLISCGKSGAPSCSDSDVTSTAVELLTKGLPLQYLNGRAMVSDCLNHTLMSLDLSQIATLKVNDECVDKELDGARAYVAKVRSQGFTSIRTTSRDDGLKKVTCTGDLAEYHNIQYSAQYTDDGQTYVEVY